MKRSKGVLPYAVVRLGSRCNAKCLFCNVPAESYDLPKAVSAEEIKTEIANLVNKQKNLKISISGGEPTINKDLPEIIKFAKDNGIQTVEIQTNAILLRDKNFVKTLKKAGLDKAFVAFHSYVPEIHDYLVGRKGAYADCLAGIKNLVAEKIKVDLNPVVTSRSYKELPGYIRFVKKEMPEVKRVSLSVIQPRGRAWNNRNLVPRYGLISPYVKKTLELGKQMGIEIFNPYCGLPFCMGNWWKYLNNCAEFTEKHLGCNQLNFVKTNVCPPDYKIKACQCLVCDLERFCNGVWKEYAEIHSLSDLKPIAMPAISKRLKKEK
ncbi:radical SAM protein [bacterium]|nr:MAG: radical SAM protein [bacterium]